MHLGFSLQVMLIGLLVVFAGLFIIVLFILLMSKAIGSGNKKTREPEAKPAPTPAPAKIAPAVKAAAPAEDQDELMAVITAALAAFTAAEGGRKNFAVRSVRRVGSTAWSRAGRAEQVGRF